MSTDNDPLQLSLGVDPAHGNRYLFSDHYLEQLLPADPRWWATLPESESFLAWLQELYVSERDQLASYNESQLEDHWFRPILAQLGHTCEGQATVPGLEQGIKRPDYVFFPDEASRQAAAGAQRTEEYVDHALAVGEVKAWQVPLGKKLKGGEPSFASQNPSFQIDYYLKSTGLAWGMLSNGRQWRLAHKDSSQRLTIYYEVDLLDLLQRGRAGEMRYFTLFFRQGSFLPGADGRLFLDDALAASNAYAVALEEDLQENVYQALEWLMQGFLELPGNKLQASDLRSIYDNSLYLLYRLLFIFYAESRELLPMQNRDYREHYSLRDMAHEIALDNAPTAPMTTRNWGSLTTLFHIINGQDEALNRHLGVPRYNGGLFNPELHPFLEEKAVGDRALVAAIDLLARRSGPAGREFVDYRTLGVRQLGSIYEGLLEYQPRIAETTLVAVRDGKGEKWLAAAEASPRANVIARREAGRVYLVTDKGERKATGSYYTPDYIVQYIVENTLGPLVAEAAGRVKERGRQARKKAEKEAAAQSLVDEILDLKVLDPAMGSGHFLVAATDHLALALATDPWVETEATAEEDVTFWKRRVVERCIYGVDKNPLAVELAKLSLWLATVAADQPLSFLDHHLKCGDSLIGADVADLGWAPPVVLNKRGQKQLEQQKAGQMNLFEYRLSQQLPAVMGRVLEIAGQESDSYESVQAKEAADFAVQQLKAPFEAVADLWTSAYFGNEFTPADYGEALEAIGKPDLNQLPAVALAHEIARQRRFFHWRLAFPEVFYKENGQSRGDAAGFDAIIGNPPYVRIQRLEQHDASFLFEHFESCSKKVDISVAFLEHGIQKLSLMGRAAFISSSQWLSTDYGKAVRVFMSKGYIERIVDFGSLPIFSAVSTYPAIIIFTRRQRITLEYVKVQSTGVDLATLKFKQRAYRHLNDEPWVLERPNLRLLLREKPNLKPLSHWGHFYIGALTGMDEVFVVTVEQIGKFGLEADLLYPYAYRGEEIESFASVNPAASIIYPYYRGRDGEAVLIPETELKTTFPHTFGYLVQHKERLSDRRDSRRYYARGDNWYCLVRPGRFDYIEPSKLIIRGVATESCVGMLSRNVAFNGANCPGMILENEAEREYLLAILNSRTVTCYLRQVCPPKLQGYSRFNANNLNAVPVPVVKVVSRTAEHVRLNEKGRNLYARCCENNDMACVTGFVEHELAQGRSDVVHDLLAYMAEQMIAMNKEKQQVTDDFWLDLEGVSDPGVFETLRNQGKWESSLWRAEACRPFVSQESRSTRSLDDSLGWNEDAFKAFVKALVASVSNLSHLVRVYRQHHPGYHDLLDRITRTDYLIDQIVYRLYGLTEEEIAIVEGKA